MKKRKAVHILMLLGLGFPVMAEISPLELKAQEVVRMLSQGKFRETVQAFDPTMKSALSPTQLRDAWNMQVGKYGAFQTIKATSSESVGTSHVVVVSCQFERQRLDTKVTFDSEQRIAGLFFLPGTPNAYVAPAYVKKENFHEVDLEIGEGEWTLPGTLSLPKGEGAFPVVILVHGSGPQDRDVTIGPNKPFRDVAGGLASKGVAVFRYEKRTRHHAARMAQHPEFTVHEETIEDAVAAVQVMQQRQDLDADRIYILGHSLGGMLAPRIASHEAEIAGLILLAAPARPLENLMLEQAKFQAGLVPKRTLQVAVQLALLEQQVAMVKALDKDSSPGSNLLGAPSSYWLDLHAYRPVEVAATVSQPLLILQGENDCQVSFVNDFSRWRRTLSTRNQVTFKSYPDLNHLLMKTEGPSTGAEYFTPGHVEADVVNDIAAWILNGALPSE